MRNRVKMLHMHRAVAIPPRPKYARFSEPTSTPPPEADPVVTFEEVPFIDSDGDGVSDSDETQAGTNPNDINDVPASLFNVFNNI